MPGYITSFIVDTVDLGFGKYNSTFYSLDLFTREKETNNIQFIKGKHNYVFFEDFFPYNHFAFSEFLDDEEGTTSYHKGLDIKKHFSETQIEHVKELPSTSYISAWARFTNDLTMEELYKVMRTYKEINFKWIAVRTAEKQGMQLMGFLTDHVGSSSDSVDNENYPEFQFEGMRNISGSTPLEVQMAKKYETHFTSLLKYLVDRHQAVDALLPMGKNYDYQSALNYIQENGISTYGVLLYGEADDLLDLYESGIIMTFDIDNVIASKYINR